MATKKTPRTPFSEPRPQLRVPNSESGYLGTIPTRRPGATMVAPCHDMENSTRKLPQYPQLYYFYKKINLREVMKEVGLE
jgi:hypothetical protein